MAELANRFELHAHQIGVWCEQLLAGAVAVFCAGGKPTDPPGDVTAFHAKIGEITFENDFLERPREPRRPDARAGILQPAVPAAPLPEAA